MAHPATAAHAPHVRTKKPIRGRMSHSERRLRGIPRLRHSEACPHSVDTKLVRRGPQKSTRTASDLPFRIATAGVILAAAVLGIAMGLAQPSWLLAAMFVSGGALIAAIVSRPRACASRRTTTFADQIRSMP